MQRILLSFALAVSIGCSGDDDSPMSTGGRDADAAAPRDAAAQRPHRFDALDLVLVMDDGGGAQDALRDAFGQPLTDMVQRLVTGDVDGDGSEDFAPPESVHIGVVSTDMGLVGIETFPNCSGLGADGVFVRTGGEGSACEPAYPPFLSFDGDAERLASDATCLLRGQGETCGFEQPLEAILKSLWPADDDTVVFTNDDSGNGRYGHGGAANGAFLRDGDESLLVLVVVMAEDDCSTHDTDLFTTPELLEPDDPLASQPLNLRCPLNPDRLFPVERYVDGLRALRPGRDDSIVFAAITGVPVELTATELEAGSDADAESFYDELLDAPEMQVNVGAEAMTLEPSCTAGDLRGYPPRRLVETARGFGADSMVRSICEDAGDTVRAIVQLVGDRLGSP